MRHDNDPLKTQVREARRRVRQGLAGWPSVPRVVPITHVVKLSHRLRKNGRTYEIYRSELVRK